MFSELFKRPSAIIRHKNRPLFEERSAYIAHCAEQEMTRETRRGIACYILNIAKWMRLADRPGELITMAEIENEAERWEARVGKRRTEQDAHRLRVSFKGHAVRWLTFVERLALVVIQEPVSAKLVAQFTDHLLAERGLSPTTIESSRQAIQDFLNQIDAAGLQLETLTASDLDVLVTDKVLSGRLERATIKRWATALRPFLRFAERQNWCQAGLAEASHLTFTPAKS